jgi:hypothetical protein
MQNQTNQLDRRMFIKLAGTAAAGCSVMGASIAAAEKQSGKILQLFDGKTLDGWIDIENNATSLSVAGISDQFAFTSKLANGADAVSVFLRNQLQDAVKSNLPTYLLSNANAKSTMASLIKQINQVLSGPSIYDAARFSQTTLRPETSALLQQNVSGLQLARLNKLLLEDAYPAELAQSAATGWVVKNGVIASTGAGRGVLYTANDYSRYRLIFTMRHLSGSPDHEPNLLIFCTRPVGGEIPLDALAGIQFEFPIGWHWDYRPGKDNAGDPYFTTLAKPEFDAHAWFQVEVFADATNGTASMAIAQPPGSKAVEVLRFKDATAGKVGPVALQMHNAGLFDEYKDITIEPDPKKNKLITTE